jgi:polysaccharide export outer membrane protein
MQSAMRSLTLTLVLAVSSAVAQAQGTYEVGPKDILTITVLGQQDLTNDFAVDAEGLLTLPVLGKVKASELTTDELQRKLTTLLADGYLRSPQVSVAVKEFKSQRVFVTGAVARPGPYALKSDRSLLALLGDIGGPGPDAGHEVIVIHAPAAAAPEAAPMPAEIPVDTEGTAHPEQVSGAEVIRISLQRLQAGDLDQNIQLRAGDTVYFPTAQQIYISGQVARPGPYRYQEGLTVLQALTIAGGVTARGAAGRTKIVRMVEEGGDKKRKELKAKMTDLVQPQDTLVVPERFF